MSRSDVTGLPELPEEDLYFRLGVTSVELRRRLPDTKWYDMSGIDSFREEYGVTSEREDKAEKQAMVRPPRHWWNVQRTYNGTVPYSRYVNRSTLIGSEHTKRIGVRQEPNPEWMKYGGPQYWPEAVYETISVENAYPLAQKLLDDYVEKKNFAALLGDYPPKKLPDA